MNSIVGRPSARDCAACTAWRRSSAAWRRPRAASGWRRGSTVGLAGVRREVAWLLGELRERRLLHFTAEEQRAACGVAETALLDGYGTTDLDFPTLQRLTAVRVATHVHDYAAYVGWTDQLVRYADAVALLVDS